MRLVLLGPPGAGKGTQAAELVSAYKIAHISTGEIFRSAYRSGNELGLAAYAMIERGELVSDEIVIALVNKELSSLDGCGWLLDGFPRTPPQATALDRFLGDRHESLDAVILIRVDGEEIVSRLNDRRICRRCGASYHLRFRPPAVPGRCDTCGGELYQRSDDQPATIRKRLAVYETETRPLIEYYAASGNLVRVNGNQGIEAVMDEMKTSLERYLAGRS